jgi:hypothetical protein
MLRNLDRRLDRLEAMHFASLGAAGPQIIRIRGGLPEPANATIRSLRIEIAPGESVDDFESRALETGIKAKAQYVILAGGD